MLYPNFNELAKFKNRKLALAHFSNRKSTLTAAGGHDSTFKGRGLEFDSVREYAFGDDIRTIDWRVTARSGKPHVKLFKQEHERQVIIVLDMNAPMRFGTKNTFKSVIAAKIASYLGWQALGAHDRTSACLFGDVEGGLQFFNTAKNKKSFSMMLKTLTMPPIEHHKVSFKQVIGHIDKIAHPGSLLYLISDFLEINHQESVEPELNRLHRKCDIVFLSVNDRSDKEIPPLGILGFHASDKEKMVVNTSSASGRELYRQQWNVNRKFLHAMASKYKVPLMELSTESNVELDLPKALKRIGRRRGK